MEIYDNARIKTRKKIIDAFWSQYKIKTIEKITDSRMPSLQVSR
ncbi:MAG: hypothetical protein ACERKN_20295 [Velocimicrobium sp.]